MAGKIAESLLFKPVGETEQKLGSLIAFLQASETKLIRLMNGEHPSEYESGNTQYGLALYVIECHLGALKHLLHLPPSQITAAMLLQWGAEVESSGIADYDGSLIVVVKFAQLDAGWVFALLFYVALVLDVKEVSSWATFGSTPAIINTQSDRVKIALVGDWGTGSWQDGMIQYPALQVIDQVRSLAPDYTIHLGDVYYAGTQGFLGMDEEMANFVDLWADGSQGSFLLNSNHEMYSGGRGLFERGLTASPFAAQNGTSYFAIQGDKWIIIGLDSAYYDKSLLFLNGSLSDDNQKNFIKGLDTTNKNVILLTHHNPISVDGTSVLPLWGEMNSALGRAPEFWYWGHIHNGIVYSDQSMAGQAGTKGRCSGHGAIPFGVAYGLQNADGSNNTTIDYFAHELLTSAYDNTDTQQTNRVLNGFTLLTIGGDSIKEEFYDQTGAVNWSETTPI